MLLPSGNDAAILLSQLFGMLICLVSKRKLGSYDLYDVDTLSSDLALSFDSALHQKTFITAMNDRAKVMGTTHTIFYNPHGNDAYEADHNLSTIMEMARLCFAVL